MVWGWDARGPMPLDANSTATGGGSVGGVAETKVAHAWPRYEAEYLKKALTSDEHKYQLSKLDPAQASVYLDHVTKNYKAEADEALKAEFEQWLMGQHECNDPNRENVYVNGEGKPVRRWVYSDEDANGKVGQARSGWKHTPWGRSSLAHLDGVRDYFTSQRLRANETDKEMQMLAEHGPQNLEQAWMYFKHWVKGRPLSDAVTDEPRFSRMAEDGRADVGPQLPAAMHKYTPDRPDAQPEVHADDPNAYNAAVTQEPLRALESYRTFRRELEDEVVQAEQSRAQEAKDARASAELNIKQGFRAQFDDT